MTLNDFLTKLIKGLRNPWIITIVGTIISTIIFNYIFHIFNKAFLFNLIYFVISFIEFQIHVPVFGIILFALSIFLVIQLYRYILQKRFLSYNEDEIGPIFWRWKIRKISKNEYQIYDLKPHCLLCKIELSLDNHRYYRCNNFECDTDRLIFEENAKKNEIIKIIKNRMEKKFPLAYKKVKFSET